MAKQSVPQSPTSSAALPLLSSDAIKVYTDYRNGLGAEFRYIEPSTPSKLGTLLSDYTANSGEYCELPIWMRLRSAPGAPLTLPAIPGVYACPDAVGGSVDAGKHTAGELDYFVGNANGRGLVRIEGHGTGEHIASMPRGERSEANAAEIVKRWNAYPELLVALTELLETGRRSSEARLNDAAGYPGAAAEHTAAFGRWNEARANAGALLARLDT